MFRIVTAAAAALLLAACATKPVTSDEFVSHGRFKADECEGAAPKAPAVRRGVRPVDDVFPPPPEHPDAARCRHEAREKAFAECRAQAIVEGQQARRAYYGPGTGALTQAIEGIRAEKTTLAACMDAKGFSWTSPR
jgi:hypothetical protein